MKLSLAIVLLLIGTISNAKIIEGLVVSVADGDTITVLDADKTQHKIRLSGIDAPEKKQAFGHRSKESLSSLVFGKSVTVETNKRDKYQREVGKVLVNGVDVNLEQISRGMAWHYKTYEREQVAIDRKIYADSEAFSKSARRGLWADEYPVAPWDFRHSGK